MDAKVSSLVLNEMWETLLAKRGQSWAKVVSDSMYPMIRAGNEVLVEKVTADNINFGDIIVFRRKDDLVVHRVIAKRERLGQPHILEKGDASSQASLVPTKEIIGRVITIKNGRKTIATTNRSGRLIQLALASISYLSGHLWIISRGRFLQKPRAIFCGAICKVLLSPMQKIAFSLT
jgi:signal peptidase I